MSRLALSIDQTSARDAAKHFKQGTADHVQRSSKSNLETRQKEEICIKISRNDL